MKNHHYWLMGLGGVIVGIGGTIGYNKLTTKKGTSNFSNGVRRSVARKAVVPPTTAAVVLNSMLTGGTRATYAQEKPQCDSDCTINGQPGYKVANPDRASGYDCRPCPENATITKKGGA